MSCSRRRCACGARNAGRARPRADAGAGRDRAAPAGHAAPLCCKACWRAVRQRRRRGSRPRSSSGRRRSCFSKCGPRRRRSPGPTGAGGPPLRRALPAWSTPYCAVSRARAPRCWPGSTRPFSIRRTGCWPDGSRATRSRPLHAIAVANSHEPALDLTVKSDPAAWAARLDGRVLPTGSVRTRAHGLVTALPGFRRGRVVGPGCRGGAAGAPFRRCRRLARRRSVRGARRQDRAARRCRRRRHRGRPRARAAQSSAR